MITPTLPVVPWTRAPAHPPRYKAGVRHAAGKSGKLARRRTFTKAQSCRRETTQIAKANAAGRAWRAAGSRAGGAQRTERVCCTAERALNDFCPHQYTAQLERRLFLEPPAIECTPSRFHPGAYDHKRRDRGAPRPEEYAVLISLKHASQHAALWDDAAPWV